MRFKVKYKPFNFNAKKASKTLHDEISASFREAIREFYRAAFAAVPVDTGMARGSLVPLGRLIRNVPTTISPRRSRPREDYYPRGKTLKEGVSKGESAFKIILVPGTYEFSYGIRVRHWKINETELDWRALETGRQAFLQKFDKSKVIRIANKSLRSEIR
jgi:hypothetical protein